MSSKRPYLTRIRAKSDLSGTGVTEDLARQMCTSKGKHYIAIVEVVVDELHDKLSGQEAADLSITQFWPATDSELEDHLRELTRVLHQNKALASEDEQLDIETSDDLAPKVSDVLAAGTKHTPHDYIPIGDDVDQCDECGERQGDPRHADQATLDDPFTADDTADQDENEDDLVTT